MNLDAFCSERKRTGKKIAPVNETGARTMLLSQLNVYSIQAFFSLLQLVIDVVVFFH